MFVRNISQIHIFLGKFYEKSMSYAIWCEAHIREFRRTRANGAEIMLFHACGFFSLVYYLFIRKKTTNITRLCKWTACLHWFIGGAVKQVYFYCLYLTNLKPVTPSTIFETKIFCSCDDHKSQTKGKEKFDTAKRIK
jgi:hypothetical protein